MSLSLYIDLNIHITSLYDYCETINFQFANQFKIAVKKTIVNRSENTSIYFFSFKCKLNFYVWPNLQFTISSQTIYG